MPAPITKNSPVSVIPGVGKVKAAAYEKKGVRTLGDLLAYYPRSYENRGEIFLLSEAPVTRKCAFLLTVATVPTVVRLRSHKSFLKFRTYDDTASCEIVFFNQDYLKTVFELGGEYRFFGKLEKKGKKYALSSPAFEKAEEGVELPPLFPVYSLNEGLSQKQIAKDIATAMTLLAADGAETVPLSFVEKRALCTHAFAEKNIHNPTSWASLARAKNRLAYEEFFTFSLASALARKKEVTHGAPVCDKADLSPLRAFFPFAFTKGQEKAIEDVRADMARDIPMSRMIVGDVGCGKTVCAMAAMLIAVQNGRQCALMAPTEILARQHYADLSAFFASVGVRVELLVGSVTQKKKEQIKEDLAEGALPVVIGTHALLTSDVTFKNPGLVVTDEQHRFGAAQRAALAEKNAFSHLLVMSATPIPRSLALVLYGDLALSKIEEMPAGRQRVDTFVVDESYRPRLYAFMEKIVSEGGKIYIVCPAIEEEENEEGEVPLSDIGEEVRTPRYKPPLHSVKAYQKELTAALPDRKIALLHGKMKSAEKDAVMKNFAYGDTEILVSTTVIEVGVNVPSACLMLVENAERFGLSQLHQLRGRVGRGEKRSYCVLVHGETGDESAAARRLSVMRETYDGYAIAEKDLAERGPGDFLGAKENETVRQSGGIRFRLASLTEDASLLTAAAEDARALLDEDASLAHHPALLSEVEEYFLLDEGYTN